MAKNKLGEYLKAINQSKDMSVFEADINGKSDYTPFIINRCLSYFPDTIIYVNELNRLPHIPNDMQFLYYVQTIRKRNRFSKWMKSANDKNLELVKEYFGYSNAKAREALKILTKDDIKKIKELTFKGGVKK